MYCLKNKEVLTLGWKTPSSPSIKVEIFMQELIRLLHETQGIHILVPTPRSSHPQKFHSEHTVIALELIHLDPAREISMQTPILTCWTKRLRKAHAHCIWITHMDHRCQLCGAWGPSPPQKTFRGASPPPQYFLQVGAFFLLSLPCAATFPQPDAALFSQIASWLLVPFPSTPELG